MKEEERDHGGLQREWLESDIYPDVLLKLTCSIYSLSLSLRARCSNSASASSSSGT